MSFTILDHNNSNTRVEDSRAEADDKASGVKQMVSDPSAIEVVKGAYESYSDYESRDKQATDGGTQEVNPEVVDHSPQGDPGTPAAEQSDPRNETPVEPETANAVEPEQTVQEPATESLPDTDKLGDGLAQLGESIEDDPLDILPGYMITHVDGKPSLNKRGVSVLAYHYGITVKEKETVIYPHETDFETAVIEIIVEGQDGRVFTGSGEAHVDETPKHQLLRMAETRAYKRAVIFATGTGIVGYQELMEEL